MRYRIRADGQQQKKYGPGIATREFKQWLPPAGKTEEITDEDKEVLNNEIRLAATGRPLKHAEDRFTYHDSNTTGHGSRSAAKHYSPTTETRITKLAM